MSDKKCEISFDEKLRSSAKSINFRDKTPLHKTMRVVCAEVVYPSENVEVHFTEPLDVRWYWGSGAQCKCIVWFRNKKTETYEHGIGSAGGYGYDKETASFYDALRDMGISAKTAGGGMYSADIVGSEIAEALGYKHIHIVEGHR